MTPVDGRKVLTTRARNVLTSLSPTLVTYLATTQCNCGRDSLILFCIPKWRLKPSWTNKRQLKWQIRKMNFHPISLCFSTQNWWALQPQPWDTILDRFSVGIARRKPAGWGHFRKIDFHPQLSQTWRFRFLFWQGVMSCFLSIFGHQNQCNLCLKSREIAIKQNENKPTIAAPYYYAPHLN